VAKSEIVSLVAQVLSTGSAEFYRPSGALPERSSSARREGSSGIGGNCRGERSDHDEIGRVLLRSSIMQGWQVIKNAAIFYSQQFVRRVYKLIADERAKHSMVMTTW